MTYDPWRDAGTRYPDVHIERCDCAPFRGAWVPEERVILLDRSLLRPERNEVLAHEIAHVDLDHEATRNGWFSRRHERDADQLAATRLLGVEVLADAIIEGALGSDEVAAAIGIPASVVLRRVRRLSSEEKHYITTRLAAKEDAA